MCPHTTTYVYVCPHTTICVLILLCVLVYMCSRKQAARDAYLAHHPRQVWGAATCVLVLLYVSSYHSICVLTRPHTTIDVSAYLIQAKY
jgi:hypothetical protein